jgi:DNA-binding IclR family transcriptional regulator
MTDNPSAPDGGSLKRGVVILKILATAGSRGLSLTQVAERADLPHPTAHRVLRQLVEERLAARNDELKRYRLGPLVYELGVAGSTLYDLRDLCDGSMHALSAETTDTVYLVVRSGFEAVCMHRLEGSFPIRTLVLEVGSRRPLGVGAGGLALLSALEVGERKQVLERVGARLNEFGKLTPEEVERACVATSTRGFSIIQDTVNLGVSAVGRVFRDPMGQPLGALSVAALSHRMPSQRIARIAELLKDACTHIERRMGSLRQGGWQTGA